MDTPIPSPDKSNGYEEFAEHFMCARNVRIGSSTVREWSKSLPRGASVLDLGCGFGVPVSQALVEEGIQIYGVDASQKMIHAFHDTFPSAPAEHAAAEDSTFFNRTFEGVVAWGLIFLLPENIQRVVILKAANALGPGGKLLFTSPEQAVTWKDSITKCESRSLGAAVYEDVLRSVGLIITGNTVDEGENYYYFAVKPANGSGSSAEKEMTRITINPGHQNSL
jgi:2-polyprenyl-3-methyl-5-hydroxy-6-metoxy-1,4-benzoquinol methylase